jgi:ribosomal protein L11 methyltransferase
MNQNYKVITIFIDEKANELIIGFISNIIPTAGFLEEEGKLICYLQESDFNEDFLTDLNLFLESLKESYDVKEFNLKIETIQNQNWNQEWEESIQPIKITDRIVIKPTWKEYKPEPEQIVIQIDPKMSFGTGHHETTRLMVWGLEKYLKKGAKVLDIGTGTGVLCIAAIFMGALSAVGIDNDEWAYQNSVENIKLNNVESKVRIIKGDINSVPDETFDIITSNIDFRTNNEYIRKYGKYLNQNGVIILSGILISDEPKMEAVIEAHSLKVIDRKYENEWCCLIVTR